MRNLSPIAAELKGGEVSAPTRHHKLLVDSISALLLFLVLREWLIPWGELPAPAKLYHVPVFVAALGCFILIDLFRLPFLLDCGMKFAAVLLWVALLYFPDQFPVGGWWVPLAETVLSDIQSLWQRAPEKVSGAARTLLFLTGMAMLSYVLQTLLQMRKQLLWLTVLTLIYLLLLDAVFGVDTTGSLWRSMAAGLLLASLSQLPRLQEHFSAAAPKGGLAGWIIGSGLLIAACLAAGAMGAKAAPAVADAWNLPAHRLSVIDYFRQNLWGELKNLDKPAVAGMASRADSMAATGYSTDDSRLGGPVSPESSLVFIAWTEEVTYWRGESKNHYDGRGWSQQEAPRPSADSFPSGLEMEGEASLAVEPLRTIVQQVLLTERAPVNRLFAGGTIQQIDHLLLSGGRTVAPTEAQLDPVTGAASLQSSLPLKQYKLQVSVPERNGELYFSGYDKNGSESLEASLQLPDSLPERVRQLAEDLTSGLEGDYEKARAVEHFLSTGFAYSLEEAAAPPPGRDFVDYFLFDQKLGYCDYFSTSMVVLLRASGVPARWVKGFAQGEVTTAAWDEVFADSGSQQQGYMAAVSNADAHSWPEVYLDGYGWVAFEPTPGFTDSREAAGREASSAMPDAAEPLLPAVAQNSSDSTADVEPNNNGSSGTAAPEAFSQRLRQYLNDGLSELGNLMTRPVYAGAASVLLAALLLYLVWRKQKLTRQLAGPRFNEPGREQSRLLLRTLDAIWLKLYKTQGAKPAHMTLREYIGSLKIQEEEQGLLVDWARLDEQIRYGNGLQQLPDPAQWRRLRGQMINFLDRK